MELIQKLNQSLWEAVDAVDKGIKKVTKSVTNAMVKTALLIMAIFLGITIFLLFLRMF